MNLVTINNTQIDLSREWEIHHSTVNGKNIFLLGNHEKIKYRCLNGDGTYHERNIDLPSEVRVSVKVISELFKYKVVLESESLVSIANPFLERDFGDRKVSLICGQNTLMWDLFYKDSNSSLQVPFEQTLFSIRCAPETITTILQTKKQNLATQIEFFKDFNICSFLEDQHYEYESSKLSNICSDIKFKKKLTLVECICGITGILLSTNPLFTVAITSICAYRAIYRQMACERLIDEGNKSTLKLINSYEKLKNGKYVFTIEPQSEPSQIDQRIRVSKLMWAITLITYDGLLDNHAQICFEGIINDKYFCKVGEFTGTEVKMTIFEDKKVKFITRSVIWMRPSVNVQEVIKMIEKEVDEKIHIPFSKFGRDSSITSLIRWIRGAKDNEEVEKNCLDWTRVKLALLNITLESYGLESFAALARFYTHKPKYYQDKEVEVLI